MPDRPPGGGTPITLGNCGLRLIGEGFRGDPQSGVSYVQTYEGDNLGTMASQVIMLKSLGARAEAHQMDGPMYRMDVVWGGIAPGEQEPTDRWELETEFIQEDLFNHPFILEDFAGATPENKATNASLTKADIERGLRDRKSVTVWGQENDYTAADLGWELYIIYQRGGRAFEIERPILRRVRTAPVTYASRTRPGAVPYVYSTGALIAAFGVPASVAAGLPDTPSFAPSYTTWGWKKRRDSSVITPAKNKIEEVKDFVFAAWYDRAHVFVV